MTVVGSVSRHGWDSLWPASDRLDPLIRRYFMRGLCNMPLCIYHILSCKQQQINVIKRKLIILGHRHFRLGPPSPWTSALAAGKDTKKKIVDIGSDHLACILFNRYSFYRNPFFLNMFQLMIVVSYLFQNIEKMLSVKEGKMKENWQYNCIQILLSLFLCPAPSKQW